jgi:hypothetical protein
MEEIKIMDEGMDMVEEVVADNANGVGVGGAVAIVAGAALAVGAIVVLGKKVYGVIKAKKEQKQREQLKVVVIEEDENESE